MNLYILVCNGNTTLTLWCAKNLDKKNAVVPSNSNTQWFYRPLKGKVRWALIWYSSCLRVPCSYLPKFSYPLMDWETRSPDTTLQSVLPPFASTGQKTSLRRHRPKVSLRHVTDLTSPPALPHLDHFNSLNSPSTSFLFSNLPVMWDQSKHPSSWLSSLATEILKKKSLNPTGSFLYKILVSNVSCMQENQWSWLT